MFAAFFETIHTQPGGTVYIPWQFDWLTIGFYLFCFGIAFIYPFFSDAFEDG
ncbi:hypothetical protein [Tuwongella immobilis]|uniref:Uncharacterized protein n=1 Tax=Tuwongella immobilis TaxID=692036 RepID=A0A6C2YSQ8_9BACT|nr:hypothetical protein [Tuwongella immobilis]VIP03985.1 unnamed protein product [Tuwongella immobilis]VTS05337.1 unnamed protein product [Tuwongella immobilis]